MARILVIDDDPGITSLLSEVLGEHEVLIATNGSEGLAMAEDKERKPDLVLLDVNIPRLNGMVVCKRIKANQALKNVPVIMLTGMGILGGVGEAFEIGADDYIVKPFSLQVLKCRVKTLLARAMA